MDYFDNLKHRTELSSNDRLLVHTLVPQEPFQYIYPNQIAPQLKTINGNVLIGQGDISTAPAFDLVNANTSYGLSALSSLTTGSQNTAFGNSTLSSLTDGTDNVAIGYSALVGSNGSDNIGIGSFALNSNATGSDNYAIGYGSLRSNTTGNGNTAVGLFSLSDNTTGSSNISIGDNSSYNNTLGTYNVVIGTSSLYSNTTGQKNTVIGTSASYNGNYSGTIALGHQAQPTGDNQFVVGSSGTNAGAVTTEINTSTKVWNVIINGVAQKILLA